jgi:hypothetical protein
MVNEPGCPECMVGLHDYPRWRRFRLTGGERCPNIWHEMFECSDCGYVDEHARWCHKEMVRSISERAWNEGYSAGATVIHNGEATNPYTEG